MFTTDEQVITFFNKRKNYGIKPGLDRINHLLALLDHPQDKIKAIHIAGTNGKGSTISYLNNALINNGYKVGVFTSPSLDGLTGHIFYKDKPITNAKFLHLLNVIYPAICELDESGDYPTEYEILTAVAFMYFANHVDIALIETAMGGREDTTNCFQPILSIITNVDKDHTAFLGETIKEIAYHKAGIIKDNIPVIVGNMTDEAFAVIQDDAYKKQANIYRLHEHFNYQFVQQVNHKQMFKWANDEEKRFDITLQMYGEHQVANSSLAMMGLVYLKKKGYVIDWKQTLVSIENTVVPGRFEVIQENPKIILDGAHNPAGIQSFLETVDKNYQDADKHLIFAAFKDKDLQKMLHLLAPKFTTITLTSFEHPRAADAIYLYRLLDIEHKYMVKDCKEVISQVNHQSVNKHSIYFITGSLHFIALVRKYLLNH
jgi:dihydrofolate synthase/folylpolyglutamate synthase